MKLVKNAVICVQNEENSKIIFLLFLSFILYGNKCDKENLSIFEPRVHYYGYLG